MDARARSALTLLVLSLLLVVGVAFGWNAVTQPLGSFSPEPVEEEVCTPETVPAGEVVRVVDVTVSVFNGGTQDGLAGDTLTALSRRGFGIGESGNARVRVPRVQIWTEDPDDPVVRLVRSHLANRVRVVEREGLGPGITVIVGDDYPGLKRQGQRRIRLEADATTCVPTESG